MGGPDAPAAAPSAHFEDAVLHNSTDFYKWHSELEATRTSETEEKFRRYAATLQGYLDACNELLGKVPAGCRNYKTAGCQLARTSTSSKCSLLAPVHCAGPGNPTSGTA